MSNLPAWAAILIIFVIVVGIFTAALLIAAFIVYLMQKHNPNSNLSRELLIKESQDGLAAINAEREGYHKSVGEVFEGAERILKEHGLENKDLTETINKSTNEE